MSARRAPVVFSAALVALLGAVSGAPEPGEAEAGAPEPDAPATGTTRTPLRVAAYNIRHGRGVDDRVDLERVAEVLRALDADVIALQEVDDRTRRTGGVDQVAVLADLLGYRGFHGPHRPYQGGFYGNAILTRLPVDTVRTHPIAPASGSALTVFELELERGVSVVSVHLAGSPEERMAQADSVTRRFGTLDRPVVLAGDFNGRPGSPVIERLARSWRVLAKSGDPRTFPSPAPDREIDFVLVSARAHAEVLEHRVIEEPLASDHRPILAVLRFQTPSPASTSALGFGMKVGERRTRHHTGRPDPGTGTS